MLYWENCSVCLIYTCNIKKNKYYTILIPVLHSLHIDCCVIFIFHSYLNLNKLYVPAMWISFQTKKSWENFTFFNPCSKRGVAPDAHSFATWDTSALNFSFLATKSVSQFTSTMAPTLSSMWIPMRPCAVVRPASFVAFAQPCAWASAWSHDSAYINERYLNINLKILCCKYSQYLWEKEPYSDDRNKSWL